MRPAHGLLPRLRAGLVGGLMTPADERGVDSIPPDNLSESPGEPLDPPEPLGICQVK